MNTGNNIRERINQLASKRTLILDGAMGSLLSGYKLQGKGCSDILCLTAPNLITDIHEAYLKAGADIIETCSFNSTSVSLKDYGLEDSAYQISCAAAKLARNAADRFSVPEKPRFVAGSLGPTAKSASIPSDFNEPSKRAIYWDELEAAYYDNARGLLDGGADLIIIETIFDTLNAKAAIFAVQRLAKERGIDVPIIVSATLTEGGRLLSGQTVEAFCVSVQHADPLALGLNCSFGAEKLKPHIAAVSAAVSCLVIAYPNAGLPNRDGVYEESPESMAAHLEEYFREGLVNIAGGCCGSTPAHISAIARTAENYHPRPLPALLGSALSGPPFPKKRLLAGMEVFDFTGGASFNTAAERDAEKNREFFRLIKEGDYDGAVDLLCENMEGEGLVKICMDDTMPGAKEAMSGFLNFATQYPDIARRPVMLESERWDVIEAGLKCLQGKSLVNFIGLKDGEKELLRSYGAEVPETLADDNG